MFRCLLPIVLFFSPLLVALPSTPEVQEGQNTVFFSHPSLNHMNVSITENKAIIHWNSFSLNPLDIVDFHFSHLNEHSAVLNRVTTCETSKILGTLQSNGMVLLINPYGIIFGNNACVDTKAFIASTLDLSDKEFLQGGPLYFRGSSSMGIVNLGTIKALGGDVALIGRYITNEGRLSAPQGSVSLGAGTEVLVHPIKKEPLFICATKEQQVQLERGIFNTGNIDAAKIHLLADGNLYKLAIKHDGRIDALNMQTHQGEAWLISQGGDVTVCGKIYAPGGEVRVLGNRVALLETGSIHTSSNHLGGEVLFGGSFQGKDRNIINSIHTVVDKDAQICVNAKLNGNGGRSIVWSDGHTSFLGKIDATGGSCSGNGGFVEISGKNVLEFEGIVDRSAPYGTPGTLLLDPGNITIDLEHKYNINMFFNPETNTTLFQPVTQFPSHSPFSHLRLCDLMVALNTGPVEISTSSAAQDGGDIIISTPLVNATGYTTSHPLTLSPARDLIIQSKIQNGGTGDIICNVGRDLYIDSRANVSNIGSKDGNVTITTQRNLSLFGGEGHAQIGYDGPFATGNINLKVGKDLIMQTNENFALIGHTNTSRYFMPMSVQGNINISSVGGRLIMKGRDIRDNEPFSTYCWGDGSAKPFTERRQHTQEENLSYQYCQIGHATPNTIPHDSAHFSAKGNIQIHNVHEGITLLGGKHDARGGYILIGHGGRESPYNDTLSGNISINSQGPIAILGSQSSVPENFCGIGFAQDIIGLAPHRFNSDHISVHSDSDITIHAGKAPNPSFIGAFTGNAPTPGNTRGHIHKLHLSANNIIISGRKKNPHGSDAVIGIVGKNHTLSSNIHLHIKNNLTIRGGLEEYGDSNTYIHNGKGGEIELLLQQGDLNLVGGACSGKAYITSGDNLSINIKKGNLNITSRDRAYITAQGHADIYSSNDINIFGELSRGSIMGYKDLTIQAKHNINLSHSSLKNREGDLLVISGRDINMNSTSHITNLCKSGRTTLVVDHNFPLYPTHGPGLLNMDQEASIHGNGPIHIFTSQQHLNRIQGRICKNSYRPASLFVDTSSEQWLTYFAPVLKNSNQQFTIFYKDGVLSQENIGKTQLLLSDFLHNLHTHDEYLGRFIEFHSVYDTYAYNKGGYKELSSFHINPNQSYHIRTKTDCDHNNKMNRMILFSKKALDEL